MVKTNLGKLFMVGMCAALLAAFSAACDSSGNGSGGSNANVVGYTLASLAKTWAGTEQNHGATSNLEVKFDALGHLTRWVYYGGVSLGPFSGKLAVSADGAVTGLLQDRRPPVAGTYTVYSRSFQLRLEGAGELRGHFTEWYTVFSEATGNILFTSPQWRVKWWMKARSG